MNMQQPFGPGSQPIPNPQQHYFQPTPPKQKSRIVPAIATFVVGLLMGSAASCGGNTTEATPGATTTVHATETITQAGEPGKDTTKEITVVKTQQVEKPATKPEGEKSSEEEGDLGNGIWEIGKDIKPGTYKIKPAPGGIGMCYWATMTDASGSFESIINNGIVEGPGYVDVPSDAAYIKFQSCVVNKK